MRLIGLFVVLFVVNFCIKPPAEVGNVIARASLATNDSIEIETIIKKFIDEKNKSTSQLMVRIGSDFTDRPYASQTLEAEGPERLVINLNEFDCTTFVETILALVLTIKGDDPSAESFCHHLQNIRYRQGKIEGYESRLHYFSEWISDNEKKGIISNVGCQLGGLPFDARLSFMSTHPSAYRQLRNDSVITGKISDLEKQISGRAGCFFPKDSVNRIEGQLEEGMIVGITTNIDGLDMVHTGILVKSEGRIHLLHASSDLKKVTVSMLPLAEYLAGNKRQTGIVVVKVNDR